MHWPGKLSRGPSWAGPSRKLDQCIGISEASFEPATILRRDSLTILLRENAPVLSFLSTVQRIQC